LLKDDLLFEQIDCVLQAIRSMRFDQPQCPIPRLQDQLQTKGLGMAVLPQNPLLFKVFKQKLCSEFQNSFFWYCPLQYVTRYHFQWQVMYLWEFLVNTPIDANTYEWLETLIKMQSMNTWISFIETAMLLRYFVFS